MKQYLTHSPGVSCDLYHNYIRIKLQEKGETVCDDTIFYSDTQTHVLYWLGSFNRTWFSGVIVTGEVEKVIC